MRQKRIMYSIDLETGQVVSRVGQEFAWPILDFEGMSPKDGYQMNYNLEKISVFDATGASLHHTRKIPTNIKNYHRAFWGMKELS